jgi:hypothetical protein
MNMHDWHMLNIGTHVVFGSLGLLVGLVPLFSAKGGDAHRRWGRIFAGLAGMTLLTALVGNIVFDPPAPLIAATLTAGYLYASGLRALMLRSRGPGLPDALFTLAVLLLAVWLWPRLAQGSASWTPMIGYSTIGYIGMVALYDLSRQFWAGLWLRRIRPIDHGFKMIGAYFAMMSAGFGNVLRDAQPYSQVGPSVVGTVLMLVFGYTYWQRTRTRPAS